MDNHHFIKNDILTIDQKKEIKETFMILSTKEEPNVLPITNLKLAMMGLGLLPSNDEIERIINQLKLFKKMRKEEKLEFITYSDFYETVYFRLANKSFENDCKKTFKLLSNGKNEITKYDIESISSHFHEKLKPEQLSEILSTADIDSDGRITENDFMNLMRHTNYI